MEVIGFQTLKDFKDAGYSVLDDKDLPSFLNKNLEKFDEYVDLVNNPNNTYIRLDSIRDYVNSVPDNRYYSIFYNEMVLIGDNSELYVDVVALSYLSYLFQCEESVEHYDESLKLIEYFDKPIRCTLI